MICPICKTKNNYYSKSCKNCGCTLDTKKIDQEVEDTSMDDKPIFLYQTKEEKEIKQKTNKKGIVILSFIILAFVVIFVIGWTQEGPKKEDSINGNTLVQSTNIEESSINNQQQALAQDKKKQN